VPEDDAMKDCTKKPGAEKAIPAFGSDSIEAMMRDRVRATIEAIVEEELEAALGARKSARVGTERQGYRHGTRDRMLTTSLGPTPIAMPRARVSQADGTSVEWRSQTVRRYQRRTTRVDEAILGVYLAGGNTRRIKGALAPLLRGGPLSKDAVSRLVGRLREDFDTWRARDLADEDIRYVFMDGWYPKVRIGGRRERVPVLVTLGVRANGERVVLDMRLVGEESAASWTEVVASVAERHLSRPVLAVIDGNPGLTGALRSHWPGIEIQRCTAHKLRNLQAKAPARLREELTEDYRRMIYGETVTAVEQARARFLKKWKLRCPAVVESLNEAGDELFTFLRFPSSQWKALRTTNALERINEEFRRRTKTQASLPSQDAVLLLLFGLLRSGQIKLRALVGYHDMKEVKKAA
jgi:transposase-like protein